MGGEEEVLQGGGGGFSRVMGGGGFFGLPGGKAVERGGRGVLPRGKAAGG